MDIQVEPIKLIEKSNEIKTVTSELTRVMDDIEFLVLSLNGNWQGDAERAFAEKIIFVKKHFSDIATFFNDYSDLLDKFANVYEQQESDLSSKINLT